MALPMIMEIGLERGFCNRGDDNYAASVGSGLLLMTEASYNGGSCYMEKLHPCYGPNVVWVIGLRVGFGKQTFDPSFLRLGTYSTVEY